jgi:hypothetical protein
MKLSIQLDSGNFVSLVCANPLENTQPYGYNAQSRGMSLEKRSLGMTLMDCKKSQNMKICTCTYDPCPRKGVCCECVAYHLRNRQVPGCFFPADAERTYDRSFEHFARIVGKGQ